jgi:hypothetical protein
VTGSLFKKTQRDQRWQAPHKSPSVSFNRPGRIGVYRAKPQSPICAAPAVALSAARRFNLCQPAICPRQTLSPDGLTIVALSSGFVLDWDKKYLY